MITEADKINTEIDTTRSRLALAYAWLAGLLAYAVAIYLASNEVQVWINDLAWTVAAAAAAYCCFRTARQVEPERRRAWLWITAACGSWLLGQLHWNYVHLILKVTQPFPSLNQIFYTGFALFIVVGVMQLPEARNRDAVYSQACRQPRARDLLPGGYGGAGHAGAGAAKPERHGHVSMDRRRPHRAGRRDVSFHA